MISSCSARKRYLNDCRTAIIERLERFRLTIEKDEAQVVPVTQGIRWHGFVTYPDRRRRKRRNWAGFTRRMRRVLAGCAEGWIYYAELDVGVQCSVAHAAVEVAWRLRRNLSDAP